VGVEKMRKIGVDLHKTMFLVCVLIGEIKEFYKFKMQEIEKFIEMLRPDDELAIESTGNTHYFVGKVKDKVKKVVVVNPAQFKVISRSVKKTDKKDAELLAFFLQKNMLPEVRMTDDYSSQLKSMTSTRDKLVKSRTVLKNKIHNILNYNGILSKKEDFSSIKKLNQVLTYDLNEGTKFELEIIVDEIKHLNESILKMEAKLKDLGSKLKGFENISSIKGIGDKSATILLSQIGNIEDFQDEKKLSAYFGLVPKVSQSNESLRQGRITKHGSKLARTTLVQCALIAKKYSPYLQDFYERVKKKRGSGKAIIATARKLLSIIFYTLKNNWVFEDFPNFVLKTV
jgi:transposase